MHEYKSTKISKQTLLTLYMEKKLSMMEISKQIGCSPNRVVYWMEKYQIKRRSISEAIYQKANPNGDPFEIKPIKSMADAELYGLGVGLFWGEGDKINKHTVRLGNTDPELLKVFIKFLVELMGVDKNRLRFGLQIFTDINTVEALNYWIKELSAKPEQFYKPIVTISGSLGTYRRKSKYGVVIVYFHNKKLRDIIVGLLPS